MGSVIRLAAVGRFRTGEEAGEKCGLEWQHDRANLMYAGLSSFFLGVVAGRDLRHHALVIDDSAGFGVG